MPLALASLTDGFCRLFADPPATATLCAHGWADAVRAYAAGIVPPSTAVTAAAAALGSGLNNAFHASDAVPGLESAFSAFAAAVGAGMAGYAPVPPAGPVGFADLFAGDKPETHAAAAERIADAIHAWLTQGVSTLAVPPNTPVAWS